MKKKIEIIFLITILIGHLSFSFANLFRDDFFQNDDNSSDTYIVTRSTPGSPFVYGTKFGPTDIDPHNAWDSGSFDVIDQVCEGLYAYNLSDPDLGIIPRLASDYGTWNPGYTEFTVPLRTGVTFHDGTAFTASAVQFSFDRLAYFMNATGTLPSWESQTIFLVLYSFPNGTPIINRTEIIDPYTIKFVLNAPYAPFEALLLFPGSYILSPTSTPATNYIDRDTGDLVGTGPFVYDNYTFGTEVNFHAYDNYWRGKANITEMQYLIIWDDDDRMDALKTGTVHFITDLVPSQLDDLKVNPYITVLESGLTSTIIQYLGMNNRLLDVGFREAISYAIDYDFIINNLKDGLAMRMTSPIPKGITYANDSFNVPVLDLTHARIVMQSMGYGIGFSLVDDTPWLNQEATAPFATFNFTYNIGNVFREAILVLLQDNLAKIGIRVTPAGMTWQQFIYRLYEVGGLSRNMLELYWIGWGPDYNDPSNYINYLYTNRSISSNGIQYNGYEAANEAGDNPNDLNYNVQLLMEAALIETNPIAREQMYDRIQELLIERDFPKAWGYTPKLIDAHIISLTGYPQNPLEKVYFYPCEWYFMVIPDTLTITTPDSLSSWQAGTSQFIHWTSTGSISDVRIELYKDGIFEMIITSYTANDGDYFLTLPSGLTDSTQYQIKITDFTNSSIYDFSDYFEIFTTPLESILITTPDSSSSWETGTSHYIYWTSTGSISNVKIELYRGGVLEMEITSDTPNDGQYSWTLLSSLTNSTLYQIKISDVSNPSTFAFSDNFEIWGAPSDGTEDIPGYNLYVLLGLICIVSIILVKIQSTRKLRKFK